MRAVTGPSKIYVTPICAVGRGQFVVPCTKSSVLLESRYRPPEYDEFSDTQYELIGEGTFTLFITSCQEILT